MFFITLSCAEHHWADIVKLIRERIEIAGGNPSECYLGSDKLGKFLNDYCIVVQEYFQLRVEKWLKTVGKDIFSIEHYWVRYEFAPGRGQIHAHLLALSTDQSIYELCHLDMQQDDGETLRAQRLENWAEDTIGLTANVNEAFNDLSNNPIMPPMTFRFREIETCLDAQENDTMSLEKDLQMHKCSAFCLRKEKQRLVYYL